jgi:hypothetical protein
MKGAILWALFISPARAKGKCLSVKREFGDIGRSRVCYAAASEALALITRVAGEQLAPSLTRHP